MKSVKSYRHGIRSLSAVAVLFVLVSIGCSGSNKSKIVGSWQTQSVNATDGSVEYTLFVFYEEGMVSKKTGIMADQRYSKVVSKMIGKYKFGDDNKTLTITWDDGNSETASVSFPQKNKMLLGKYELEKIK